MIFEEIISKRSTWRQGVATRAIECPDGSTHMVTIDPFCWDSLDHMAETYGFDVDRFYSICFEDAMRREGDFAYTFSLVIQFSVFIPFFHIIKKDIQGMANDNIKRHDTSLLVHQMFRD
ncbi:MAG: hypothetical protein ACSHX0_13290 [Akkermansiaceae bacterium]